MTRASQLRAILLAVLMVGSVLAVGGGTVAAAGTTDVSLSPSSQTVQDGNSVTYDVVVESADGGVGAYTLTVNVSNGSVATITGASDQAGLQFGGEPEWNENDNTSVSLSGAGGDTDQTGQVTIATITVTGQNAGTADVTLDVSSLGDESGSSYTVSAANDATVTTEAQDGGGNGDGDGTPDHDADLVSDGTYWAGQTLLRDAGVDADEELEIWSLDADGNKDQIVDQPVADADGFVTINTADLDGRYLLEDSQDNPIASNWLVTEQNMDVVFDPGSANNAEHSTITSLVFDSNRGRYTVEVSADGLSEDELLNVLAGATAGDEADDGVVDLSIVGDPAVDADFTDVETGNYTFTVTVKDTGVEDSSQVTVTDPGDAAASFASPKTFQQHRGDTLAFTVNLQNTDTADVIVGSTAVNYRVELTVTDAADGDDDDGTVTVLMDTYRAGGWTGAGAGAVYSAADSGDSVTATRTTDALSRPLSSGDYGLEVQLGGQQEDGGSVFLLERSTDSLTLHTAPAGTSIGSSSYDEADELLDATTESSDIAEGDWVVVQVQASGLYEYVTSVGDLESTMDGVTLTITQTSDSTRANADPIEVGLGDAELVTDAANDQFFVAVQADWPDIDDGHSYDATFTVTNPDGTEAPINDGANPLLADDTTQSVSGTFDIAAGSVAIDTNVPDEERLVISSDAEAEVSGTSSYAPGTSLTVVVESGSSDNPYFERQTTTVSGDGTWSVAFDTSDLPEGVELSISARRTAATEAAHTVEGEIGTPPTPEPAETVIVTRTVQVDSPTPRVVTEEVEVTREVEVEVTRTVIKEVEVTQTPGQPGFGIAVAILALLAAAMLALRRRD